MILTRLPKRLEIEDMKTLTHVLFAEWKVQRGQRQYGAEVRGSTFHWFVHVYKCQSLHFRESVFCWMRGWVNYNFTTLL